MPVVLVSVTNDLTTDQRVDRTCQTLQKTGHDVLLIGRYRRNSQKLAPRSYKMHRMRLLFDKGPLFYAEYNITLFFFLLFHHFDLLVSNDLDTLAANYLANRIKRRISRIFHNPPAGKAGKDPAQPGSGHIHDCHEYFRGVPELVGRKFVIGVWKWIEDAIFPRLKYVIAVNQSIADLYSKEYHVEIGVVRNVPFRKSPSAAMNRSKFNIREDQKVILYQGAVNVDRGLEEVVAAMKFLETDAVLVIAGIGDIFEPLRKSTDESGLASKVRFLGQVPFQELHFMTLMADIGISIEKDVSVNYHYCLPNKFLDYIQAGIPVLVSPFPEMKAIVDQYHIGEYIGGHEPESLARSIDSMLNNPEKLATYKQNLIKAADDLCWENEEKTLLLTIERVTNDQ